MGILTDLRKSYRNREDYKNQVRILTRELESLRRLLWCIITHRHNGKIIILQDEMVKAPRSGELLSSVDMAGRIHIEATFARRRLAASENVRGALA